MLSRLRLLSLFGTSCGFWSDGGREERDGTFWSHFNSLRVFFLLLLLVNANKHNDAMAKK